MNAPTTITPLSSLVEQLCAGDVSSLPRSDFPLYGNLDWRDAAEYAQDADDLSDLEEMLAREAAYSDFCRSGESFSDKWAGFENYWSRLKSTYLAAPMVSA
jgi:hypothetical protein